MDGAPANAAAEAVTPAAVAKVEKRPVILWSAFSGRLEAIDRVEVPPRVAGEVVAGGSPEPVRASTACRPASKR